MPKRKRVLRFKNSRHDSIIVYAPKTEPGRQFLNYTKIKPTGGYLITSVDHGWGKLEMIVKFV